MMVTAYGAMQYMIYAQYPRAEDTLLCSPVAPDDAAYLRDRVAPTLRPLSDDQYKSGPTVILHTAARWSYILWEKCVFWCVEWAPGLLVFRFSPDSSIEWTAARSPVPNFGGRDSLEEDLHAYDRDSVDHQYNLVFNAWDAQFDEDYRLSFKPATQEEIANYEAALSHVREVEGEMATVMGDANYGAWLENCINNLALQAGAGLRL